MILSQTVVTLEKMDTPKLKLVPICWRDARRFASTDNRPIEAQHHNLERFRV